MTGQNTTNAVSVTFLSAPAGAGARTGGGVRSQPIEGGAIET